MSGKLKILWLTVDRSNRVAHHFDDFRRAVMQLPEVRVEVITKHLAGDNGQNMWQLSRNLISNKLVPNNIIDAYDARGYDFIFCDAFFAYFHEEWRRFKAPSAVFIEDVHQEVPKFQVQKAKSLRIQNIFHRFNFAFHKFHPEARFEFSCFWLPHSVNMDRYSDHIDKSIDVLHVGVHPRLFYPFRHHAIESLKGKDYFKLIERPKDTPGTPRDLKWPIDRDYDNLLQSAKITVTGGSIFNAPVQKYVEIPAANSLLLTNWFPDLGLLGFVPNTNMVSCYQEDLVKTVEWLLDNENEVKRISTNGHHLISLNHTSEIRSKQFVNNICDILGIKKLYNINPCSFQVNFKPNKQEEVQQPVKVPKLQGNDWKTRILNAEARNA